MKCQKISYKWNYFKPLTEIEYQCLICFKKIQIELENSSEELLNEHLLSKIHLQTQLEILAKFGHFELSTIEKNHVSIQTSSDVKLFKVEKAQELNKQSKKVLNEYFTKCLQKINGILKIKLTTQKVYLIILKRFYNFVFDLQSDSINENHIMKFLEVEQFKLNSISALTLLSKALSYSLSPELLDLMQKLRIEQQRKDLEKAEQIYLQCQQFMELLFKGNQKRLALMIFLLFQLEIAQNNIPQLLFQDFLNDKIQIQKKKRNSTYQIFLTINQAIQLVVAQFVENLHLQKNSYIMPEIRKMRDIQTLLDQIKKDFESNYSKLDASLLEFIHGFNFQHIKFIKRSFSYQYINTMKIQINEIPFPNLVQNFLQLLDAEIILNKTNIAKTNIDFIKSKRSKSQLQLQRNKNRIQMIQDPHEIITLEDSSNENIQLQQSQIII